MWQLLQYIILGLVQGLTEFLPVSSSGHLILMEKVFHMESPGMVLEVMLHMGTLAAVVYVYWEDIRDLILHPLQSDLIKLVIATIPAVVVALFIDLDDIMDGQFLGFGFLITSGLLLLSTYMRRWSKRSGRLHRNVTYKDAIAMGCMQGLGVVPAVSRSGSTIVGGIATGLSRTSAARFSFLMSIPAILGAAVLQVKDILSGKVSLAGEPVIPMIVAVLVAAAAGVFAIKFMLSVLRKGSFKWFSLYVAIVGVLVLFDTYVSKYFF